MAPKRKLNAAAGQSSRVSNAVQVLQPLNEDLFVNDDFFALCQVRIIGKRCLVEVRDQGKCICCWSMSAADAVAAKLALQKGDAVVPLSNQVLIDCMPGQVGELNAKKNPGIGGCYTSSCFRAFKYTKKCGLLNDEVYPFNGKKGNENRRAQIEADQKVRVVRIQGSERIKNRGLYKLKLRKALSQQVVTVTVPLFYSFTMHVGKSIYEPTEEEYETYRKMDKSIADYHSVCVIDWGEDPITNAKFWYVKNSEGKGWGYFGFGKISARIPLYDIEYPVDAYVDE